MRGMESSMERVEGGEVLAAVELAVHPSPNWGGARQALGRDHATQLTGRAEVGIEVVEAIGEGSHEVGGRKSRRGQGLGAGHGGGGEAGGSGDGARPRATEGATERAAVGTEGATERAAVAKELHLDR